MTLGWVATLKLISKKNSTVRYARYEHNVQQILNYDDSVGCNKSTLGEQTVKSFKCVIAKGLLFSAI